MVGHVDHCSSAWRRAWATAGRSTSTCWRWPARGLPPAVRLRRLPRGGVRVDEQPAARFEPDPAAVPPAATRARAFRNTTFVGLHYLPPAGHDAAGAPLRGGDADRRRPAAAAVPARVRHVRRRAAVGRGAASSGRRADQLASYLLATTAYREQPCADARGRPCRGSCGRGRCGTRRGWRSTRGWRAAGWSAGIHLATVDVHTPGSPHPLTFQECYGFDFPLRWVTRLDCVSADRQPAVDRAQAAAAREHAHAASWRRSRAPGGKRRGQSLSKEEGDTKPEKDKAIAELAEYRERLAEDPLTYATVLVQVPAPTREEALRNAQLVAAELGTAGVACNVTTIGRWPAYLSCIPGNVVEARRYRAPGRAADRERAAGGPDHGHERRAPARPALRGPRAVPGGDALGRAVRLRPEPARPRRRPLRRHRADGRRQVDAAGADRADVPGLRGGQGGHLRQEALVDGRRPVRGRGVDRARAGPARRAAAAPRRPARGPRLGGRLDRARDRAAGGAADGGDRRGGQRRAGSPGARAGPGPGDA